jgi:hypothetical protein
MTLLLQQGKAGTTWLGLPDAQAVYLGMVHQIELVFQGFPIVDHEAKVGRHQPRLCPTLHCAQSVSLLPVRRKNKGYASKILNNTLESYLTAMVLCSRGSLHRICSSCSNNKEKLCLIQRHRSKASSRRSIEPVQC